MEVGDLNNSKVCYKAIRLNRKQSLTEKLTKMGGFG